MSDFDILNLSNKKSFVASLNKRRIFGLDDSDSSSEEDNDNSHKRKKTIKHVHEDPDKQSKEVKQPIPDILIEDSSEKLDLHVQATQSPQKETLERKQSNAESTLQTVAESSLASNKDTVLLLSSDEDQEDEQEDEQAATEESDISLLDDGIEDLDPDLAAFLTESTATSINQPEKITIKLQYVIPKQQLVNEAFERIAEKLQKPMKVIVMNNEQFDRILTIFCNHKKLKKDDIVLVYKEGKVFLRGTPAGVGMTGSETHMMYVYTIKAWEEKLERDEKERIEKLKLSQAEPKEEETTETNEEDNALFIKLRGNDKKEIRVRVKPTTRLSAVVEMYKKITKVTGNVQLYFEGESLDLNTTIDDTELEDEDLLDVGIKNE
ncbi:hypothetical protein BCV72DRAFT_254388 [Rhizopus microsporus var. microsporus]|uniref:Rad60/SUMO-like domain-containing protein n=2 Tax=Rhizopus microsporus TaxID=58291 RepID=A0A1X0RE18_RHIZD|nr:hypothetical protein BCV72DRAFT_254388 [Rhizopus microsporus var. microsporus]